MGKRLSAVIKLSESCNLNCTYCYQSDQLRSNQEMTLGTLRRICEELERNSVGPVPILWYGGEPTLVGLKSFQISVDCAQQQLQSQGLEHSLQTNGILIDESWAKFLAQRGFRVRLSLDGPDDLHNDSRPGLGGRGSHAQVIKALRKLQHQGIEVRLACTITRASLPRARDLVHFFEQLGVKEIDFTPALRLGAKGSSNQAWIEGAEYGQFLIDALEAWLERPASGLQIRSLAALIRKLHGLDSGFCKLEGNCSRFVTFGWDGRVYPCDEFSSQIQLGNILNEPLEEILRRRPLESSPGPACRECQWETTCPGSLCPFERIVAGDGARASIMCSGWRRIQEHLHQRGLPAYSRR